jgi:hypothetical protein
MKSRLKFFLAIVVTIVTSSGATYLLMNRNDFATIAQFDNRWEALPNATATIGHDTGWRTLTFTDSLTKQTSTEYATSMTTLDGPAGLTGELRIRCSAASVDVYILFSSFFTMQHSFWKMSQDGEIVASSWMATAGIQGRASSLQEHIQEFSRLLIVDRDLRIRIRVIDGPEITMKPEMQRGNETVAKVRSECKMAPLLPL